mgnify:CR=1 FL=1
MTTSLDELVLDSLEKHVHRQNGVGRCGLAVARSVLDYQFGIPTTEEDAVNEIGQLDFYSSKAITINDVEKWLKAKGKNPEELTSYEKKLLLMKKHGLPPSVMATYFRKKV